MEFDEKMRADVEAEIDRLMTPDQSEEIRALLRTCNLEPCAKLLAIALIVEREIIGSQNEISDMLWCSHRSIMRGAKKLESMGLMERRYALKNNYRVCHYIWKGKA